MSALPAPVATTAIPLPAAIGLLRRLGLSLAGAVTRRQPAPALAHDLSGRELDLLLPFAGLRGAVPLTPLTLRPWLRQLPWLAGRGLGRSWSPPDLAPALGRGVERGLASGAPATRWERAATIWVDRLIGGVSPRWLAEPFWELAGEAAWGDAAFQAEVAHLLVAELRTRVLFTPGVPPAPIVSPRTFWALIALAEPGAPASWRMLLRRRAARRGLRRLQKAAGQAVLAPGWADLWDQWLIVEALRLWGGAAERVTPELRAALVALPLHARLHQVAAPPEPGGVKLAAAGWARRLPPWLDTLARWDREPPAPVAAQP